MAYERQAKKLYFNLTWASGATTNAGGAVTKFIPCTPFRSSVTIGDRYGSLLEPLAAVTGNSSNLLKRAGAVEAWFVVSDNNVMGRTTVTTAVAIDFVAPTLGVTGNTDAVPLLPYLSVDGTSVVRNRGKDTIYGTLGQPRHFSIRARRLVAPSTATLSGTLYVARQHSIEV
jgi:hypothetical protein